MVWKKYQQVLVYICILGIVSNHGEQKPNISSPLLLTCLQKKWSISSEKEKTQKFKCFSNSCQTKLKFCQDQCVVHSHYTIYFPVWFLSKGSGAWWVCNQQALLGLSLNAVRLSLMCAAVNTGSSLPTTVSWGMRLSTRTLMSTLEGSHRRKMLQL